MLFIRGIVKAPVVATLADVLPLIVPIRALESTEILAGPPFRCPVKAMEMSLKKSDVFVDVKKAPKSTNR